MKSVRIYYLCNKRKCPVAQCERTDCHHTNDVRFSKNYKKRPTREERIKNFIMTDNFSLFEQEVDNEE